MILPTTEWRETNLGNICTFKYGKPLPKTTRSGGNVPVYGSNGVVGYHDSAITTGKTIVIGRKGSHGEVNFSENPCWPIDTAYFVDETSTEQDIKWLSYRLASLGLNQLNKAAAVPGLNREDAYRQELLVPPLTEQRRIAAILDQADAFRTKRREALAQLESLTQSIFIEIFGDPSTNPRNWPTRQLSELVAENDTINYGVVQPGDDVDDGIPLIRVGDLINGRVRHDSLKKITPEIESAYKRSRLHGNEILVSCVGSVGVVVLADESVKGFNIARAVARIRLSSGTNREFVAAHLQTESVQRYFTQELRTVSQPTLNIKQLSETKVIWPPASLQQEFSDRINTLEKLKFSMRSASIELDALFASLQHRAFQGEL